MIAHALGVPVSPWPCLKQAGEPDETNAEGPCPAGKANPNFIKPKKTSGRGHRPGGDFLVTLGFWGNNFLGPYDIQVATLAHEIGHNLWRTHRGDPINPIERNCNPNYPSVMNYLFQTQLLRNANGEAVIDLSGQQLPRIDEQGLPFGLGTMAYRTSWYAPKSDCSPVTRYNGGD